MNKEKEYADFIAEIVTRVETRYEGKVRGEVCTSVKNNGISVTGMMLKGENRQMAPSFYLEPQFVQWLNGHRSLDEIAEQICNVYEEEIERNSRLVSEIQFDWRKFHRRVFMRLVNKEKNLEQLQELPYREFLDLALVYYYSVPIPGGMSGTMIITKEHLKLLEITEEELHQAAINNRDRFQPAKIRCMEEVVCELAGRLGVDIQEAYCKYPFLYVLTNVNGFFGASAMTAEEELESFSQRIGNSFYVLPSSVHEVILVPDCKEFSVEYFSTMVREINETHVEPTEVLSNSIYYYDKELKIIRRVA